MDPTSSVQFFDAQFQRQLRDHSFDLNPFEVAALPHLQGRVLDFGCGLGNLAIIAATQGCSVVAVDASHAAISRLREVAVARALPLEASEADLRTYELTEQFDTIISIGLLMFFDCPTARQQLTKLQAHVRPGGIAVVNVMTEGSTYFDMFDANGHCLFARDEMRRRFVGWNMLLEEYQDFAAPNARIKSFVTVIAQKPLASAATPPPGGACTATGARQP